MKNILMKCVSHLQIKCSTDEIERMYLRLNAHSKSADVVFTADSKATVVLDIDRTKVNQLYQ